MKKSTRAVSLLMVEDDEVDAKAMYRAVAKLKLLNPLLRAVDGLDALDILRGNNPDKMITKPYIILLDINMPRMNGIEFLQEIRKDSLLSDSIVFILTTSDSDKDRLAAFDKNVAGYIVKSNLTQGFMDVLTMLDSYWRVVELPC